MVSLSRSARWCWACSQGSGPKFATPLPPPGAATTVSPSECRAAIKAHAVRSATGSAACTSSARRPCSGPEGRGDHQCLDPSRHPVPPMAGSSHDGEEHPLPLWPKPAAPPVPKLKNSHNGKQLRLPLT